MALRVPHLATAVPTRIFQSKIDFPPLKTALNLRKKRHPVVKWTFCDTPRFFFSGGILIRA